jgi:hypothetical protein
VIGALRRWREQRGRLPQALRAELEAEGVLLLEERLKGSATYRQYQVPGQRAASGVESVLASLALTRRRLVVHGTRGALLNAPVERGGDVAWDVEEAGRLRLRFEVSDFDPHRSGSVELRLDSPRAAEIHASLQEWIARSSS